MERIFKYTNMNRIITTLTEIKNRNKIGLMTHAVIGYPNLETSFEIVKTLIEHGADFLELQIPFSDPLGDGPVIREANSLALSKGLRVSDCFEFVKKIRAEISHKIPILLMTYANIPMNIGLTEFCTTANAVGADGLIIPDYNLANENREQLITIARKNNLFFIPCLGEKSSEAIIAEAGKLGDGFMYCFALQGLTGSTNVSYQNLTAYLEKIKIKTQKPVAVGFGISSKKDIEALGSSTEIVIVGSALIRAFITGGLSGISQKIHELTGL